MLPAACAPLQMGVSSILGSCSFIARVNCCHHFWPLAVAFCLRWSLLLQFKDYGGNAGKLSGFEDLGEVLCYLYASVAVV